jgi:hypothetical protein
MRLDREEIGRIRLEVRDLCRRFPLYPDMERIDE